MTASRLKAGYFTLEGLNSFATTYFFYYFYFLTRQRFGFGNKSNLTLAALSGLVYVFGSWGAGRFGQRKGYFAALKIGYATMLVALLIGSQLDTIAGLVPLMLVTVAGMCFIWPSLEALVSEGETPAGLQHNVGVYNVVWSGTGALAYFTGGAMVEKLGFKSMFFIPAAIMAAQFALTMWLERASVKTPHVQSANQLSLAPASERTENFAEAPLEAHRPSLTKAKAFLRMAWLANPFAYIAINTLIAVMPGVAARLHLTPMMAGFCCSAWCFARLGAFFALWYWPGWHYRFRWLVAAFAVLIGSFAVILMVPNLAVIFAAQLLFGVALGLIYYSSLFYSMDVGETKGEHGGIHEAAIGVGNFAGPAVGAAALHFLPQYANSGAVAVSALLMCGLGGLMIIWRMAKKS